MNEALLDQQHSSRHENLIPEPSDHTNQSRKKYVTVQLEIPPHEFNKIPLHHVYAYAPL